MIAPSLLIKEILVWKFYFKEKLKSTNEITCFFRALYNVFGLIFRNVKLLETMITWLRNFYVMKLKNI